MTTLVSTNSHKLKSIEVKYSNMTFILEASSHYIKNVNSPGWTRVKFTGRIKETGENIGVLGGKKMVKNQMNIINSRPDLFLN